MIKKLWEYRKIILAVVVIIAIIIIAVYVSDLLAGFLGLGAGSILGFKSLQWVKKKEDEIQEIEKQIEVKKKEIAEHEKVVSNMDDNSLVDAAVNLRRKRGK